MDATPGPTTDVAICIVTYLRPVGLARCLESLAGLRFGAPSRVRPRVVVVDNDAAGSARAVVERVATGFPWPLRYAIEPRRGISFARNHAVALAGDCAYVAFVDDDEYVEPTWLDELARAQCRYDADVVTGPVLSAFEADLPAWIARGRFFERQRAATGTPLAFARTGNVLIRREALARVAGPFDSRFALSGAEDAFLFKQLARSGARLVWCDEAVVTEVVPASRTNLTWLVQRAYRTGNTIALCERAMPAPWRRSLLGVGGGALLQILVGLVKLPPSSFLGRAWVVRRFRDIANGVGLVTGLCGRRYEEYRRIHGA